MGTATGTARPRHRATSPHDRHAERPRIVGGRWPVARLTARLVRREVLALAVGLSGYMLLESAAFRSGYPDEASRAALTQWGRDPAIRILAGPPTAVDTLGGFVVWDAGLYLTLAISAWAITVTTRVVRGDEASGRTDLVLAGPRTGTRVLLEQLATLIGASLVVGLAVALPLIAAGAQAGGSAAFGAAEAGFTMVTVAVAGTASQVFLSRSAASGAAAAVVAAGVLARMVANSADERAWLGWLTPSGWLDQVRAFDANRGAVLALPVVVTAGLVTAAAVLRARRDTGAAVITGRVVPRSTTWGLGGPGVFAWRSNLGVLLGWAVGVAAWGGVVGSMAPAIGEFLVDDPGFQAILAAMGMDVADLVRGFVGMSGTILGLVIALYGAFRLGAVRAEEASTRAELLLTRPVTKPRWLLGHLLGLAVGAVLLAGTASAATWAGAATAGADVTAGDAFAAVFNTLPAVSVFVGLTVLALGLAPRLTTAIGASLPLIAYVLQVVGPLLDWPDTLVALSPFHHLEAVPVDPFGLPAALVMLAVGTVTALAGVVAFERRDLVSA